MRGVSVMKRLLPIALILFPLSTTSYDGLIGHTVEPVSKLAKAGIKFDGIMFNHDGHGHDDECTHATLPEGTKLELKSKQAVIPEKKKVEEKIAHPLPGGKLESKFGKRGCRGCSKIHKGIDLVKGKTVVAALDGEVSKSGWASGGFGKTVVIDHKNEDGKVFKTTLYGHLSQCKVKQGQTVKKGQLIGIKGSTGRSTGAHLHFEIANNKKGGYDAHTKSKKVDPLPYLYGKPITEKFVEAPILDTITCTVRGKTHFDEEFVAVPDKVAEKIGQKKSGMMAVQVKVLEVPRG